jgi:hypothetical protein
MQCKKIILAICICALIAFSSVAFINESHAETMSFHVESSANDGYVYGSYATYPYTATNPTSADSTSTSLYIGQVLFAGFKRYRAFLKFDTSLIPSDAIITSAKLRLYGKTNDSATDFLIQIRQWTDDYPITVDDYNQYSSGSEAGSLNTTSFSLSSYNNITITNLNIIEKSDYTKICLISSRDIGDNEPTGLEVVTVSSYEDGANQPILEVTYSAGSWGSVDLHGPFNENGLRNGAMNVTYQSFSNSTVTFELDGIYSLDVSGGVFRFDLGNNLTRTYYVRSSESNIYVFKPEGYAVYYYFDIADLLGIKNGYLESMINVNGTYRVVERWAITQGTTPFVFSVGHTYRMRIVCDQGVYIFGDYPAISVSQTYTLVVTNAQFPSNILSAYKYIRIYASRTFADPTGVISAHYQDVMNATISVAMTIKMTNGTLVDSKTETSSDFIWVFSGLANNTDYVFDAVITHSMIGSMQWRQTLTHEFSVTTSPFGLDFLGPSSPIITSYIIPIFIIFAMGGVFSVINRELGAFVAGITAIFLSAMQWFPLPAGAPVAILAFIIMAALHKGKSGQVILQ